MVVAASSSKGGTPCTMVLSGCRFSPILIDPMSTRSLKRRLIAGFGANTFSRLSTTLTQIFSVPVFLSHWGVHLYGEWILLNTIPSYLGLSDVGFGSVAGNEMTMLAAAQNFDQALVVFQSVWVLTTVITSLLGLLLIAAVWFLPLGTWLHMHAISAADARLIVLLLGLAVLLGMQETLFQAAFRCVGKYPLGTMAKSLVVLAAFLSTMVGVGLHLSPVPVTVLYVAVNAVGVVRSVDSAEARGAVDSVRHSPRAMGGHSPPYRAGAFVHELPAGQRAEPAGDPGGDRLGDGSHRGGHLQYRADHLPQRCPGNEPDQQLDLAGDVGRLRHRSHGCRAHAPPACLPDLAAALPEHHPGSCAFLGDWIWKIWTVGKVPTDPVLLNIMLLQMVVSAFWFTSSVVPMAINQHQRMARAMLTATCLALVLAWVLMHVSTLGLRGAAIALVAGDLVHCLLCVA